MIASCEEHLRHPEVLDWVVLRSCRKCVLFAGLFYQTDTNPDTNQETLNALTSRTSHKHWAVVVLHRCPHPLIREVALLEKIVRGTGWGQLQASADGVAYQLTLSREPDACVMSDETSLLCRLSYA